MIFQGPQEFFDISRVFIYFSIVMLCCSKLPSHWCKTETKKNFHHCLWFKNYPGSLFPLFWDSSEQISATSMDADTVIDDDTMWQTFSAVYILELWCFSCKPVYLHALPWYCFSDYLEFHCNNDSYSYSFFLLLLNSLSSFGFSIDFFYSWVSKLFIHPFISIFCNPIAHFSTFVGLERHRTVLWGR